MDLSLARFFVSRNGAMMALAPTPRWAKITVAAEYQDVSVKTIRRWISAGLIDARRVGPKLIRVDLNSLDRMGRSLQYVEADQ
jgi:excisionase family DNA binding protein